jgi:hypothetical protein
VPLVNAYIAVAELREEIGDTGSILDTDVIERAINAASRAVDNYCSGGVPGSRRFWRDAVATTRVFRADSPTRAWVMDISTTTSLVVKTDEDGDGTYERTWTSSDYQLEPLNQDVVAAGDTVTPYAWWEIVAVDTLLFPVWVNQRAGLQVTARFGWSSVPDEVKRATLLKAVSLFKRKDAPFGVAGFGEFGAVRITRNDPDVVDLLSGFRKTRTRTLSYRPQARSLFHW